MVVGDLWETRVVNQVGARLERVRGPQLDGDAGEYRVRELDSPVRRARSSAWLGSARATRIFGHVHSRRVARPLIRPRLLLGCRAEHPRARLLGRRARRVLHQGPSRSGEPEGPIRVREHPVGVGPVRARSATPSTGKRCSCWSRETCPACKTRGDLELMLHQVQLLEATRIRCQRIKTQLSFSITENW